MILARRKFLTGMLGLVAAPAIVKVENLMRISVPRRTFIISRRNLLENELRFNFTPAQSARIAAGWRKITEEFPPGSRSSAAFRTLMGEIAAPSSLQQLASIRADR